MTLFSLRPLVTKTLKRHFSLKIDTIAFSNSQSIEEKLAIIAINQNSIINGVYSLGSLMNDGFKAVTARLDSHDKKFDAMDQRMDKMDQRVDTLDKKMDEGFKAVNLRVDTLDKKVDTLNQRVDNLDKKVDDGFKAANMRMDAMDKKFTQKFEQLDKKIESSFNTLQRMIKDNFGESEKTFEVLCSKIVLEKFSDIKSLTVRITIVHQQTNTREEIDIFSEDPLCIIECTQRMKDLSKLEKTIRKREFIERVFKGPCRTVVMINKIEPEIIQQAEKFAKDNNIILLYGIVMDNTLSIK